MGENKFSDVDGVTLGFTRCVLFANNSAIPGASCTCIERLTGSVSSTFVSSFFFSSLLLAFDPVDLFRETARRFPAFGGETLRSEEHTSELKSLMRISYAVFCLKKQT